MSEQSPYYSTDQFIAKHQAFTMSWLRSLIQNAETNGLISSGGIIRAGRKILIDEPKFIAWLKEKQTKSLIFELAVAGIPATQNHLIKGGV